MECSYVFLRQLPKNFIAPTLFYGQERGWDMLKFSYFSNTSNTKIETQIKLYWRQNKYKLARAPYKRNFGASLWTQIIFNIFNINKFNLNSIVNFDKYKTNTKHEQTINKETKNRMKETTIIYVSLTTKKYNIANLLN